MLHIQGRLDDSLTDQNITQTDSHSQTHALIVPFCVTFRGRHFVYSGTPPNDHQTLLSVLYFVIVQ